MKTILTFSILILNSITLFSQTNRGTVTYKTLYVDTIQNTIIQNDSAFFKFTYKPNKAMQEQGFTNHSLFLKTIIDKKNVYSLMTENDIKEAYHMYLPEDNSFNKLLNYRDTSLIITKYTSTKIIAGRACKKMCLQFNNAQSPRMVLWYDETINCNSLIPGVGIGGKAIKGLVLEYEIQQKTGKCIITANSINFANIADNLFIPNLLGYTLTEIPFNNEDENEDNDD